MRPLLALLAILPTAASTHVPFQPSYFNDDEFNPLPQELGPLSDDSARYIAPTFVDVDDDGDMDLVIGNRDGSLLFAKNTGDANNPTYAWQNSENLNPFHGIQVPYGYSIPTFVDLDDDKDMDLVVGNEEGKFFYFKNDNGVYTSITDASENPFYSIAYNWNTRYSAPAFVDLDNDGDMDLVSGSFVGHGGSKKLVYYENTGSASNPTFVKITGETNPLPIVYDSYTTPAFVDVDNDGDMDLFVGTGSSSSTYYYENTGEANAPAYTLKSGSENPFQYAIQNLYGYSFKPTFVDIDNDKIMDLVVGNYYGYFWFFKYSFKNNWVFLAKGSDDPASLNDAALRAELDRRLTC